MPNPDATPPVVFDEVNRELRTVRFHYQDESVLNIAWQPGVRSGARIAAGQLLATIRWTESEDEEIRAPGGCEGTVESTNRQIPYEELDDWSIWLLSLEPEA